MLTDMETWENLREMKENYQQRDIYKDKHLALLLANGQNLGEAIRALGMDENLAEAITRAPTFKLLVDRLRKEREKAVYSDDPDEMTESLARGNVWTLKEIRDNPTGRDSEKLKAALALHEMRPSVRKERAKEAEIRVVFGVEVIERLQEGLKKIGEPEIEAEFKEVGEVG